MMSTVISLFVTVMNHSYISVSELPVFSHTRPVTLENTHWIVCLDLIDPNCMLLPNFNDAMVWSLRCLYVLRSSEYQRNFRNKIDLSLVYCNLNIASVHSLQKVDVSALFLVRDLLQFDSHKTLIFLEQPHGHYLLGVFRPRMDRNIKFL